MKKLLVLIAALFLFAGAVYAQEGDNTVQQMDDAVRSLARNIHAKLLEVRADKVLIGQFTFNESVPVFSTYWVNQLIVEVTNTPRRNYTVIAGGSASDATWTIVGEIVQVVDVIRVYTRLVRVSDRAIEGSFFTSFQRNEHINNLIAAGSGMGGGITAAGTSNWDSPFTYTIGSAPTAPLLNRTLTEGAEDFFLLVPDRDGRLTVETVSGIDTYMHLYNYDNGEELAQDDDSGQGLNARIVYNVRSGTRYLAVVRGFRSSVTGPYSFRAFIIVREGATSFNNPLVYEIGANESSVITVNRTLQEGDNDHFLLVPTRDGRLTIETTGRIDTYLELYNADTEELLDEDDDSGQSYNARIRYNVRAGSRYIALVRGYSNNVRGGYGFKAFFPGQGLQQPDEFEPDDEPAQAKPIAVGESQRRTFHSGDDVDWVRFQITRAGRYIISARGENNNRLDTYLELYDSNLNLIAEDDDGGDGLSARLSLQLAAGTYFIKVWCLDDEPDQAYVLSLTQ